MDLTAVETEYRQMQLDHLAKGYMPPVIGSFYAPSERQIRQRASELGLCAAPEPEPSTTDLDAYFRSLELQIQ